MLVPPCSHVTVTPLVVRPRDMDADRNVNNAVYFEYFHQSRLEHLVRLAVWQPRQNSLNDNSFAIAENTCRYLRPSFYGDVLRLWTATHAVGRSSFQLVYQVWRESDQMLIATAHSVQVWLAGGDKSTPLPSAVRTALTDSLCPHIPKLTAPD